MPSRKMNKINQGVYIIFTLATDMDNYKHNISSI